MGARRLLVKMKRRPTRIPGLIVHEDRPDPRVKWGLVLQGQRRDLEDWKDALPPGGDPWVEITGVEVVLRSTKLDGLSLVQGLWAEGHNVLRLVGGAIATMVGACTSVTFNEALEFHPDKAKPARYPVPRVAGGRTIFELYRKDIGALLAPTDAQKWLAVATADNDLADALMLIGGEVDWYDIYKVVECLEHKYGGEHALLKQRWVPKSVKKLKETGNWARHRRRAREAQSGTLSLNDGRTQVFDLLRRALAHEASRES
jgi:hypothetical protein